jgi:hypothetical protein
VTVGPSNSRGRLLCLFWSSVNSGPNSSSQHVRLPVPRPLVCLLLSLLLTSANHRLLPLFTLDLLAASLTLNQIVHPLSLFLSQRPASPSLSYASSVLSHFRFELSRRLARNTRQDRLLVHVHFRHCRPLINFRSIFVIFEPTNLNLFHVPYVIFTISSSALRTTPTSISSRSK